MATPLDTNSRTDDIVDGISRLVLQGGFEAVTLRAIAEQVGISAGTLVNHLTNRERILRVCAFHFARRRMRELDAQVCRCGPIGLMPMDDHDLRSAQVWLAWRELARHAEGPANAVAGADHTEEWLLRRALAAEVTPDDPSGRLLPDVAIQLCRAALHGLREAVGAHGEHALDVATARDLWARQLDATRATMDQAVTASARARSSATIASGSSAE
jgi:AcrR family transcriptional regulator